MSVEQHAIRYFTYRISSRTASYGSKLNDWAHEGIVAPNESENSKVKKNLHGNFSLPSCTCPSPYINIHTCHHSSLHGNTSSFSARTGLLINTCLILWEFPRISITNLPMKPILISNQSPLLATQPTSICILYLKKVNINRVIINTLWLPPSLNSLPFHGRNSQLSPLFTPPYDPSTSCRQLPDNQEHPAMCKPALKGCLPCFCRNCTQKQLTLTEGKQTVSLME